MNSRCLRWTGLAEDATARDARGYDADLADRYDAWQPPLAEDDPRIRLLVELARGGPVLELGIGTGRFALPLVRAGLDVRGIDLSEPMVAKLRARPGGDAIPVVIGDLAGLPLRHRWGGWQRQPFTGASTTHISVYGRR